MFQLSGARAELDMAVTFTTADGRSSTYKINKSMEFHETAEGQIVEGRSTDKVQDKDNPDITRQATNIVINMDDKASVMGGNGNDSIDLGSAYESYIEGGEGDDVISARVLDRSVLNGGKGDDVIAVDQALSSVIDAGAGDDLITVNQFDGSTNSARLGANRVPVLSGGAGNDTILVGATHGGIIAGNEGDDTIVLARSNSSLISGGKGNDAILTGNSTGNIIDGGAGSNDIRLNLQAEQARQAEPPDTAKSATNTVLYTEPTPDVVVDNGQIVQGTAQQLGELVQTMVEGTGDVSDEVFKIAPYSRKWRDEERSGTLLNRDQKAALQSYLQTLQQLAERGTSH